MDLFNKLPPEVRLQILIQLGSKRSVLPCIQVSPIMLEQYGTSKAYIKRAWIAFDLDDEMMQDGMAIILFPSWDAATSPRGHFDLWVSQQLPNPFEKNHRGLLDELEKLHSRLLFFIEDYLTKATAIFPPRDINPKVFDVQGSASHY
ncbi:hypothetical protein QQX98_004073 [Neonectria punicea]|uniref:Uncharacterized protein n=1 Tax=Neonectria punicea TaxID=979145 RepID=A0ABR1HAV7_9HYPO